MRLKNDLCLGALDVAGAGGGDVHVPTGINPIAIGGRTHPGAVLVVKPLRHWNSIAGVPTIKVAWPSDILQVPGRRGIDIIQAPRGIDHF